MHPPPPCLLRRYAREVGVEERLASYEGVSFDEAETLHDERTSYLQASIEGVVVQKQKVQQLAARMRATDRLRTLAGRPPPISVGSVKGGGSR